MTKPAGIYQSVKGRPRPADTYRGARRNSEDRKAHLHRQRSERRHRWRLLELSVAV